jgi:hypothetical protein
VLTEFVDYTEATELPDDGYVQLTMTTSDDVHRLRYPSSKSDNLDDEVSDDGDNNDDLYYWDDELEVQDTENGDCVSTATSEDDVGPIPPMNMQMFHEMFKIQERQPETGFLIAPIVKINPNLADLPSLPDFLDYNDEVATLRTYVMACAAWRPITKVHHYFLSIVSEARARAAARSQQFLEDTNKTSGSNSNGVKNNVVPCEQPLNIKTPTDETLEKVHDDVMVPTEISRGLSKRDSVS